MSERIVSSQQPVFSSGSTAPSTKRSAGCSPPARKLRPKKTRRTPNRSVGSSAGNSLPGSPNLAELKPFGDQVSLRFHGKAEEPLLPTATTTNPFEVGTFFLMRHYALLFVSAVCLLGSRSAAFPFGQREKSAMNHLKGQKSPYLLQHATNPVDWFPWGDEAFAKARREEKLIFLSIGYSTCHWCHVMESESFRDPEVAALMNEVFVSIIVDREERPDLDEQFLSVSQMLSGTGGWPLTIIMTPDGKPFYAATYLPRDSAYGRLGMRELVPKVRDLWKTRHADVVHSAEMIAAGVGKLAEPQFGGFSQNANVVDRATKGIVGMFDATNGGFGSAPKFPRPSICFFLLRSWLKSGEPLTLRMVEQTLQSMRNGGIYDQLGFGFHRYATDAAWRVPHFEKMLYDQALGSLAYTEAWQATGKDFYRRTADEIFTYVLRDLALPEGGFASAEDADSQGSEGKFYLWSAAEIRSVLGEAAFSAFSRRYHVSDAGNLDSPDGSKTGENILHRSPTDVAPIGELEKKLLAARNLRVRPFRDDKVLADWNGLMIAALAHAGAAFDNPGYISAAKKAASFILARMRGPGGTLLHRYRGGEAAIPAFADDYAFLSWGMLELYEATFDAIYLKQSLQLIDGLVARFWDPVAGGFFQTAQGGKEAIARKKPLEDGVLPSANSVALLLLLKLNRITGNVEYEKKAEAISRLYPAEIGPVGISFGFFLSAIDFSIGPSFEVVVAGDPEAEDTLAMVRILRRKFLPNAVIIFRPSNASTPAIVQLAPFTESQLPVNGRATAYVCQDFACKLPTNDIATMLSQLEEMKNSEKRKE